MTTPPHDADDDPPPHGPIADFAAELHGRAQSLRMDCPFTLTAPEPTERPDTQPGLFDDTTP